MKKRIQSILLLTCFLTVVAYAATARKNKTEEKPLRIYLHSSLKAEPVDPADPILAQRVYVKYEPHLKNWVYTKTDARSNFAKPPESLQTGSVVTGLQIGADDILGHFKLNQKGFWEPTKEPLRELVRVDDKFPYIKVITYQKLALRDIPQAGAPSKAMKKK